MKLVLLWYIDIWYIGISWVQKITDFKAILHVLWFNLNKTVCSLPWHEIKHKIEDWGTLLRLRQHRTCSSVLRAGACVSKYTELIGGPFCSPPVWPAVIWGPIQTFIGLKFHSLYKTQSHFRWLEIALHMYFCGEQINSPQCSSPLSTLQSCSCCPALHLHQWSPCQHTGLTYAAPTTVPLSIM